MFLSHKTIFRLKLFQLIKMTRVYLLRSRGIWSNQFTQPRNFNNYKMKNIKPEIRPAPRSLQFYRSLFLRMMRMGETLISWKELLEWNNNLVFKRNTPVRIEIETLIASYTKSTAKTVHLFSVCPHTNKSACENRLSLFLSLSFSQLCYVLILTLSGVVYQGRLP